MTKITITLTEDQARYTATMIEGIGLRNQSVDKEYAAYALRIAAKLKKSLAKAKTS
jgi:hypothetical protein